MARLLASAQDKLIPAWLQPVVALDLLHARGVDLSTVLQGTALFVQDLPFAEHRLTAKHFDRLLANGDKLWPGKDYCFQLGHQLAEEGAGPLRTLMSEEPRLKEWVALVDRFNSLLTPSLTTRVHAVNEQDYFLLLNHVSQFNVPEATLRTSVSLLTHALKRSALKPTVQVFLQAPTPPDIELFHAHVPAQCHFNSPFNGLRIQVEPSTADDFQPSLRYQVALRQCNELNPPKHYLMAAMTAMLWQFNAEPVSLQFAAEQLQVSSATLKRRLKEAGCSFQQLSDSIRSERAVIELLLSGASVEQVGARLHFQDTSNFRRALKRWTGMTPSHLKAAYQELFGLVS